MTAPNHLVGGFTFTGIFGSLMGINILSDHRLLPVLFVACLLPDIDHTKSLIGKVFLPISRAINRHFGHRTITHSLMVWGGLTGVLSVIQNAFFPSIAVYQVFGLAYGSHLLLDMITVQGIPLFYPFKKNPCVIPGRPDLRFRSGNMRHEAMGMCLFTVSAVFMQPLMADGFWTSYNRLFGTLSHIVSEYNKSDDLLEVSFKVQHGSETMTRSGYCVAVSSAEITVLDASETFITYPQEGQLVSDFYPTHTRQAYHFQSGLFYDISLDSLHRLYAEAKYVSFRLQGSRQFTHHTEGMQLKVAKLDLDYSNQLHITEIPVEVDINFVASASIGLKEQQLQSLIATHTQAQDTYTRAHKEYLAAEQAAAMATDRIEKELLMIQFAQMKVPKPPKDIANSVATMQAEIRALKQADYLRYSEAQQKAVVEPLTFSGSYEKIIIQ